MALEKYIVQEGQSIYDVVLQKYGTLNEIFTIFVDNPEININSDLTSGQKLLINKEITGEQSIKGQYLRTSFITNNADGDFVPQLDQKQFQDGEAFDFQDGEPYEFN